MKNTLNKRRKLKIPQDDNESEVIEKVVDTDSNRKLVKKKSHK